MERKSSKRKQMVSISVVMPAYNVEISILQEAVESILSQTFQDFEFIIIDDCSTDGTFRYLEGLQDERIRLIRNPEHLGCTKSLNIGLNEARGKYIARMDSDDISLPTRFEKQYKYMERHPDVILCGTNVEYFGIQQSKDHRKVKNMDSYRVEMLFHNPGPMHPTAFFNHALLDRYQIRYDEKLTCAQDYGLWAVISRYGKVHILDEILVRYRIHDRQVSCQFKERQVECDKIIMERQLRELLGNVTREEVELHQRYGSGYVKGLGISEEAYHWFRKLVETNDRVRLYKKSELDFYVYDRVIKQLLYRTFSPDMSYFARISMFFRYIPPHLALRASIGMTVRTIFNWW